VCEPKACFEAVRSRVAASLADVPVTDIVGVWKHGDGRLSGSTLYLFPDRAYVYAEWADVQSETIYDKGVWQLDEGVLLMTPDAEVAWTPESDRRFLALRPSGPAPRLLLFGIDGSLERFTDLVQEHLETTPAEWLRVFSFERGPAITLRETAALKAGLLRTAWRPAFFAADERFHARLPLAQLLDIVDGADRVEALPVTMSGMGLSASHHVEERPVQLDSKTGQALGKVLTGFDWDSGSPMACMFQPAVAFRFHRGDRHAQVLICFECSEMMLDGLEGPLGGKKPLGDSRRTWLRAAKRAFPNDPILQREK
jgi:hypothetical protein